MRRMLPLYFALAALTTSITHSAFSQEATKRNPPSIAADLEMTLVSQTVDGTNLQRRANGRFLRDAMGRTSIEQSRSISISDPVAGVSISVDTETRKAVVVKRPRLSGPAVAASRATIASAPPVQRHLGTRDIEGFQCTGTEAVQVIPVGSPLGNDRPLERITESWIADDLRLPLLVIIRDPLSGTLTTRYTHISVGEEFDPSVFAVPEGFDVIERDATVPAR